MGDKRNKKKKKSALKKRKQLKENAMKRVMNKLKKIEEPSTSGTSAVIDCRSTEKSISSDSLTVLMPVDVNTISNKNKEIIVNKNKSEKMTIDEEIDSVEIETNEEIVVNRNISKKITIDEEIDSDEIETNEENIVNRNISEMTIDEEIHSVEYETNEEQNVADKDFELVVEPEKQNDYIPISGRRIVDINYFMSQLQEKAQHNDLFDCKLGYFKLIGEKRSGFISKFKFECNVCKNVVFTNSENCSDTEQVNANVAATTGVIAAGIGYSQFEELFSALDIPVFSKSHFLKIQDTVYENWELTAAECMKAAANREKEAAIAEGRVKDGIPLIDVCVDGAWGSRSYGNNYRSLSGVAAIIGKRFGEVLYMGVKNKYCVICARAKNKNEEAKEHKCFKNFEGSSSSMEAELIAEGFKASVEMYGIIYARMIADGDSSTYNKVLEANPYPNYTVEKLECKNHILRNFCNKLRALSKETKYLLVHRKTLTTEKIMSMRKYIVTSIKHHNKNNANSDKHVSISLLHDDIRNSVAHAYGDHRLCGDYNCSRDKSLLNSTINQIQNSTFLFRINAIVGTAAAKARSLIENVDTNAVERFNSVVAKFVGGKRINFSRRRGYQGRCHAAVVSFNNEAAISTVQKSMLGKSPKGQIKKVEKKRSKQRKFNREYPVKKLRKYKGDTKNVQHDYGEKSSAPDMHPEQLQKAKEDFLINLNNLTKNRKKIERSTVLQKDSSEWLDIRKNIITASNFGSVCKRRASTSTAPLVKNILYKKNISHVSSIAHGLEHESQALEQLQQQEGIVIQPCGLFIDEKYPFIGATPDGIVEEDTIVEVKCPISAFKKDINALIQENKIQIYKYDKKKYERVINKRSNWYYQVQGQLHVTKRSKCIFGIWSGENKPMIVEYIFRDDKFWEREMRQKLVDFYLKCLLIEIVDPRFVRGMPIREITLKSNEKDSGDVTSAPDPEVTTADYTNEIELNFEEL